VIDLKFLRENPEVARESQRTRGEDPALVDQLLEADAKRREVIASTDALRSEQKGFGKKIGQASKEERPTMLEKAKELSDAVKAAEAKQKEAEAEVERLQYLIGNIVTGAPAGGEDDFVVLEEIGEIPQFDFEPKDHLDLGESLGLIDMERGVKVSGSRFYFLTGYGAMLQLAMMNLAAQKATQNGFQLMVPPVLVRPETMSGTGFLGAHSDEIYTCRKMTSTWSVPRKSRWPATTPTRLLTCRRGRVATLVGLLVSVVKRALTARTPAESCACTSSTSWRCSPTVRRSRRRQNTRSC